MANHSAPIAQRDIESAFKGIARRHLIVKFLRIIVPILGAVLFAYLVLPMVLSTLFPAAQFDAVRINSDRLIIDAPRAKGALGDGGRYRIAAHSAETGLTNQDSVDLVDMVGDLWFADGTTAKATSDDGRYNFLDETLEMLTPIEISSSNGDKGRLGNGVIFLSEQRFTGGNGVRFDFIDGSTLDAATMKYNSAQGKWEFTDFTLVLIPAPEKDVSQ
ncbi:hypothetical protein [Maritalea porphyrae]|jgi:lipopolysaccharide export system protein LptC|uniref:hypothetical protein n=1 Tax=Maritalea porphyrae TaxID=880732 RepID=UPI0022B054AC|nr:hypothetical protein [Maritalea porphyrae]MCZ4271958.1 hypothetical protein [Maritalea porphyrae]